MAVLGQRVQVGDFYAVVKYMGPVTGTDGKFRIYMILKY